jgi:hypothetical protein
MPAGRSNGVNVEVEPAQSGVQLGEAGIDVVPDLLRAFRDLGGRLGVVLWLGREIGHGHKRNCRVWIARVRVRPEESEEMKWKMELAQMREGGSALAGSVGSLSKTASLQYVW